MHYYCMGGMMLSVCIRSAQGTSHIPTPVRNSPHSTSPLVSSVAAKDISKKRYTIFAIVRHQATTKLAHSKLINFLFPNSHLISLWAGTFSLPGMHNFEQWAMFLLSQHFPSSCYRRVGCTENPPTQSISF